MPVLHGVAVERPLEAEHDRGERVQQVEVPQADAGDLAAGERVLHERGLVHDRRHPEPHEQPEVEQVADVAVAHVHGGGPQRDRGRERPRASRTRAGRARAPRRRCRARSTTMNSSSTAVCSTKSKSATPTEASGRISRGNATFFTRFALSITERRAREQRRREQVPREQAREQEHREVGHPVAEHDRDEREDREEHDRVQQRPDRAEERRRVLDLQLLAHEVREDLAIAPELAQARHEAQVRRLGRALGDGRGGDGGVLLSRWARARTRRSARRRV